MAIQLNNRRAVGISSFFLLISIAILSKYLFFYDSYQGAAILLWTIPVGVMGIITSMYVKKLPLKVLLVGVHLLLGASFLLPFLLWGLFGA